MSPGSSAARARRRLVGEQRGEVLEAGPRARVVVGVEAVDLVDAQQRRVLLVAGRRARLAPLSVVALAQAELADLLRRDVHVVLARQVAVECAGSRSPRRAGRGDPATSTGSPSNSALPAATGLRPRRCGRGRGPGGRRRRRLPGSPSSAADPGVCSAAGRRHCWPPAPRGPLDRRAVATLARAPVVARVAAAVRGRACGGVAGHRGRCRSRRRPSRSRSRRGRCPDRRRGRHRRDRRRLVARPAAIRRPRPRRPAAAIDRRRRLASPTVRRRRPLGRRPLASAASDASRRPADHRADGPRISVDEVGLLRMRRRCLHARPRRRSAGAPRGPCPRASNGRALASSRS